VKECKDSNVFRVSATTTGEMRAYFRLRLERCGLAREKKKLVLKKGTSGGAILKTKREKTKRRKRGGGKRDKKQQGARFE